MNAPPENANARLQPGERAIRQTYEAKLRSRAHHVNRADSGPGTTAKYSPKAIGGALP